MGSTSIPESKSSSRTQTFRTIPSNGSQQRDSKSATGCHERYPAKTGTDWITYNDDPKASAATYASTIPPRDELEKKNHIEGVRERYEAFPSEAIASTPFSFAGLFPSCRRLLIRHDDTTRDGNLNLRISTIVTESRERQCEVILFHLRMLDLQDRKFSFRRYCRQSGREVCHSSRKYQQPTSEQQYSPSPWTNGFWPLRSKPYSLRTTSNRLRRQDSGYRSEMEGDELYGENESSKRDEQLSRKDPTPTNTIKLEFSNYAHVNVERRGSRVSKRYDYEYWSTRYQWRRSIRQSGNSEEVYYDLYDLNRPKPIAHIVPEPLSPMEALDEESKGGWIPPSSIWISDSSVFKKMSDIAEWVLSGTSLDFGLRLLTTKRVSVVIATGLIALLDDNIKRHWHSKEKSTPSSPIASTFIKSVESLVSTKVFNKVFQRRWSSGSQHINSIRQLVLRGHGS
ncbi:hypothetical protein PRK78_004840 [Emydomyces testavorans]|uniref:Uncharacterized protein n=1 Tax=Emydomyces testavorans TaxID=2070801 RepID=A0AAF0IM26_9EURO|nr:hypothetical protein PRK78_004840 [Emydomyces testavorans]